MISLSMLNSLYDKIGLNLKCKRALALVLENILAYLLRHITIDEVPHVAITHNSAWMAEWSNAYHLKSLVIVVC